MIEKAEMTECAGKCNELNVDCPCDNCKNHLNYPEDHNCCLISIDKHRALSLRDVGKRMGVSFVRIQQIEKRALKKLNKLLNSK